MMNKEIYFNVEGNNLYLDFMLEKYEFVPIFYICIDDAGSRYAVLCSNFDNEEYVIVKSSLLQLNDMLQGILDVRDVFLMQKTFWKIQCPGENYSEDLVSHCDIAIFPKEILPEAGFKYQLFDEEHRQYAEHIQQELQKEFAKISVRYVDNEKLQETVEMGVSNIRFTDMIGQFSSNGIQSRNYLTGNHEGLAA